MQRRDIHVYTGADSPLISKLGSGWPGHGEDGMGGVGLTDDLMARATHEQTPSQPASSFMVDLVSSSPHNIEILAIGPLTNIALAIKLDPAFAKKVKHLHIMGGCEHAKGNASFSAEFNIHSDPEAAHIVFEAFSHASLGHKEPTEDWIPRITIVPWETCVEHTLSWEVFDTLTKQDDTSSVESSQDGTQCFGVPPKRPRTHADVREVEHANTSSTLPETGLGELHSTHTHTRMPTRTLLKRMFTAYEAFVKPQKVHARTQTCMNTLR